MHDKIKNLCDNCQYNMVSCNATSIEWGLGFSCYNVIGCDLFTDRRTVLYQVFRTTSAGVLALLVLLMIVVTLVFALFVRWPIYKLYQLVVWFDEFLYFLYDEVVQMLRKV